MVESLIESLSVCSRGSPVAEESFRFTEALSRCAHPAALPRCCLISRSLSL
jgi:hypothetical protein